MRLVLEGGGDQPTQWSAINSVSAKLGGTAETLREWVRRAEREGGQRPGPASADRERVKALEREGRELRQADERLRKAGACFAMVELDRRSRT